MKTVSAREIDIDRKWYVVDASGKTLGRMATEIASILRVSTIRSSPPTWIMGDFVIVINEKIHVTGNRLDDKMYYHYSGYPGGLRERSLREMLAKKPEMVIIEAVRRMLPKKALGSRCLPSSRSMPALSTPCGAAA